MPPGRRLVIAAGVVILGAAVWVLVGTSVAGCLGPIGVTAIQCARATGIYPSVGVGMPFLALAILIAVSVAAPGLLRPVGRAALAEALGAGLAVVVYLALRPTTWSGAISTGEVITVDLPLDLAAVGTAAILGATVGVLVAGLVARPTPMARPGPA